ncbi:MAG: SRPBCC family protein [Sphingomonadales bacterium]|nr:SRPBCC family protein [Sphingomonadales bacterium]
MKILKYLLFLILFVVGIALLSALFIPKTYEVKKQVYVDLPPDTVFAYVSRLKNQGLFSVWAKMDPNMKVDFEGADGTVGFLMRWDSPIESVGAGEQEIVGIEEGKRINYKIRFIRPFKSESDSWMSTRADVSSGSTEIEWGMTGSMPYPMNLFLVLMDLEGSIGRDLQNSLNNLKGILEQQTSTHAASAISASPTAIYYAFSIRRSLSI